MALNLGELNAVISADDRGFRKTIDRVHDSMDRTGKKMGGLTGLLGALGKATAFSAMATGAAGAASAIGPLLSLVSTLGTAMVGLGAAVPAFAASGAAVIGTLTLAFQGLGDAIAGDEEALERLAGPARDFVGVIEDLKPAWEDLQQSVQGKFFEGLSGTFKEVAGNVLPHLKKGLTGVADGLSDMAAAALDAADSPQFLAGMNAVLESTENGLKIAAEGMGGFVRGFGILMETFAPLIERAGLAVANLGENFEAWMTHASATGRLNEIIATMLDTLSTLGGIIANIGSIFGSVFSAANEQGGGLLGVIEDLTGRLSDFFKSAQGQEALTSFFSALSSVADAVVPIVLELADAFATDLAPHIATIAEEVGPSLRDLVRELGDAIGKIDIKTLAEGFVDVLDAVIPLISPFASIVSWFSQIEGLVPVLVVALVAWTVAQWALNAAMYANPILLIIMLIAALIAAIVLIIINWDSVAAALVSAWEWIKEKAVEIWGAIADHFRELWDAVAGFFVGIWESIKGFFVGIWNAIVGHVRNQVNAFLGVMGWFASLPGKISGWFGSVKDAAVAKLVALVDWVKGLPGRIMGALGDLGSLLKDAGMDLLRGFLDGIESMWNSVQDKLSDLTDSLPDWKGPAERDRTILGPAGEMVIGGFVDGLERAIPSVQRALAGLTTDIGLQVDGSAGALRVEATTSLSEEDRALLRELAEARNQFDIRTDANTRVAEIRRDAMVVG